LGGWGHSLCIVKMKLKIIQNALSVISFEWTSPPPLFAAFEYFLGIVASFARSVWVWVWVRFGSVWFWLCQSEKAAKHVAPARMGVCAWVLWGKRPGKLFGEDPTKVEIPNYSAESEMLLCGRGTQKYIQIPQFLGKMYLKTILNKK